MANVLSVYNPIFYAQEALIQLEKVLGMAGRVHRGYSQSPQDKGDTISIGRPSTFTAQDAPSTAQDVEAGNVDIQLNYWREVKFKLTDKELSHTKEKIIDDHIRPAAYALADDIDQKAAALYKDVPWYADWSSPAAWSDLTNAKKILFDNKVPQRDGRLHAMVDGTIEAELENLDQFSKHSGAGDDAVSLQREGNIGRKLGIQFFANQNAPSHTSGTSADADGAVNNASGYAKGVKDIAADGFTLAGTVKAGDIMTVTGHTQQYAITADATASSGAFASLKFTPGLEAAVVDDQVVSLVLGGAAKGQSLFFHQNAFALATAPLSTMGRELGAMIEVVTDPITNIALRSRVYYVGDASAVHVALDVLFGVKTLDENLALRVRNQA